MAFCPKCGAKVDEQDLECKACGNKLKGKVDVNSFVESITNPKDVTDEFETSDIENSKVLCLFAYLQILILIPLVALNDSPFAKFHVNQGLLLLIFTYAYNILKGVVSWPLRLLLGDSLMMTLINLAFSAVNLLFVAAIVYGIYNAVTGKAREIPVIGKYRLYK